jgi:microcystin-dependent protein
MDPFIGQIILFGGNFAPRGWAFCHGQLLPIAQWNALFSILGTTYGGDGRTTFGLPDLRGRVAVSQGTGPGLPPVSLGQKYGRTQVNVTAANLPNAPVRIPSSEDDASGDEPDGLAMAISETPLYGPASASGSMAAGTLQGGNQPLNIAPPTLGLNYIIAMQGTYPSRS